MIVGQIGPVLTKPVQQPVPESSGAGAGNKNGGVVPPWLLDQVRILPWPWPDDHEVAQWSNN